MIGAGVSPFENGRWYRFHPLLAEYLKQRLESELANETPGLHQRASRFERDLPTGGRPVETALAIVLGDLRQGAPLLRIHYRALRSGRFRPDDDRH
jgi:ATP/maltotriose-dependent transcriptional regulator MalT